jgi:hypothetical protein
MWRILFAILGLATMLAGVTTSFAEGTGMITVVVVDRQGNPVPKALVSMLQPKGGGPSQLIPECTTDDSGACSRVNLPMGAYLISARKPSDGYPDIEFEFYSHEKHSAGGYENKPALVDLTQNQPTVNVTFTLGPKAAFLKPEVIDSATGASIANFTIILRNAADPNDFIGIGEVSGATVLVPPNENIQIEISAPGYTLWRMSEHPEFNKGGPLRLRSEEMREVVITLKHQ